MSVFCCVAAIILLVTHELLYVSELAARIALVKRMLRLIDILAGNDFWVNVLLRVAVRV
jgi:hypothetical protein